MARPFARFWRRVGWLTRLDPYRPVYAGLRDAFHARGARRAQLATLPGRLAISEKFKGQKRGEFLLLDAPHRLWQHSRRAASAALIVDAKDEAAKRFYQHFDFMSLPRRQIVFSFL